MGSADGEEPGQLLRAGKTQEQQIMTAGRRRAAGIYGAIITAAIIAAVGGHLRTLTLAVSVLVTLVVYWVAEEYAELLGEQVTGGRLPTWRYIRAALATPGRWSAPPTCRCWRWCWRGWPGPRHPPPRTTA